ncbi:methyltransferase domain-containing protein [Belliella sp. DSM 107340]|uniref:Methyltransferase domain-containing protein n=1 Tax=Belliella calami TaxID=2923436 RepID=A0ABS9UL76_9BACT|nr:methyltransferase domain-containing protein [Belliella calami]MCH7397288.1 methyltransferase domain-containing protein [Belliella calami]
MMGRFSQRSYEKEIMDDLEFEGPVLEQSLKELRTINKLLGGNKVTTTGLQHIIEKHPQEHYSIADLGCGGGDMIRVMSDWSKKKGYNCNFLGIDANRNTIDFAKDRLKDLNGVLLKTENVFDESFEQDQVDIITCTLFTHHFTDEELVRLFKSFVKKARLGIVINDLHRHRVAYFSIKVLTRFFSKSPMVQNDGPLSVLRGFSKKDLHRILRLSGLKTIQIRWFWAFRWRVIGLIL